MNGADRCSAVAGTVGKMWKRHRRAFPPSVRDSMACLLLELRLFVLPAPHLDVSSNIGCARYDVRGIAEMLKHIATQPEASAMCRDRDGWQGAAAPAVEISLDLLIPSSLQLDESQTVPHLTENDLPMEQPGGTESPEEDVGIQSRVPDASAIQTEFFDLLDQDAHTILSQLAPAGADAGAG